MLNNQSKTFLFPSNKLNNQSQQDTLIYQLEQEKFRRELCKENYKDMLAKFEQLQKDYTALYDTKNNLEKDINSLIEERYNKIKDWQDKNDNLTIEINKKIEINQNMYVKNNNIYIDIDKIFNKNENLKKKIQEQESILNKLNEEKNDIVKLSRELTQKNELNENDINYILKYKYMNNK